MDFLLYALLLQLSVWKTGLFAELIEQLSTNPACWAFENEKRQGEVLLNIINLPDFVLRLHLRNYILPLVWLVLRLA